MGKAVAIQLAQKGANVVVVSRTVKKLEEAVESLKVPKNPITLSDEDGKKLADDRRLLLPIPANRDFTTSAPISRILPRLSECWMR